MPTIKIHNVETDEIIEREMNDEELAQWQADLDSYNAEKLKKEQEESKRKAALEKLEALGLDLDDLKALGLG